MMRLERCIPKEKMSYPFDIENFMGALPAKQKRSNCKNSVKQMLTFDDWLKSVCSVNKCLFEFLSICLANSVFVLFCFVSFCFVFLTGSIYSMHIILILCSSTVHHGICLHMCTADNSF